MAVEFPSKTDEKNEKTKRRKKDGGKKEISNKYEDGRHKMMSNLD